MRVVIQRVSRASVTVNGECVGAVQKGLMLLVGLETEDTIADVDYCVRKCLNAKLWPDSKGGSVTGDSPRGRGEWRQSVMDIQGGVLVISQFTLFGNIKKGTKPDFHRAMPPGPASELFSTFVESMRAAYVRERVQQGVFGGYMTIDMVNDGPVTIIIESTRTTA